MLHAHEVFLDIFMHVHTGHLEGIMRLPTFTPLCAPG